MKFTNIVTDKGNTFRMRVVRNGDSPGQDMSRPCKGKVPLVEFYPVGQDQPIAQYNLDALLGTDRFSIGNVFAMKRSLRLDDTLDRVLDVAAMADVEMVLFGEGLIDKLESGRHVSGYIVCETGYPRSGPLKNDLSDSDLPENADEWAGFYRVEKSKEALTNGAVRHMTMRVVHAVVTQDGELKTYEPGNHAMAPRIMLGHHTPDEMLASNIVKQTVDPKQIDDSFDFGPDLRLAEQVRIGTQIRALGNRIREIGQDYPGLGLCVSGNQYGMIVKLNHQGRQVDFNDQRFDMLEKHWPGLAGRVEEVLDAEIELREARHMIREKVARARIALLKNRETEVRAENPHMELV